MANAPAGTSSPSVTVAAAVRSSPWASTTAMAVMLRVRGVPSRNVTGFVGGTYNRFGDFYARRLIDSLGLGPRNGVVRASLVHYNTAGELDRLIAALDPVL